MGTKYFLSRFNYSTIYFLNTIYLSSICDRDLNRDIMKYLAYWHYFSPNEICAK